MLDSYQKAIRFLLRQNDYPGVTASELRAFKTEFGSSAFTCRLISCPRATAGFELEKDWIEHERAHVQRLRCTVVDCKYPLFRSRQALRRHISEHHKEHHTKRPIRNYTGSHRQPQSRSQMEIREQPSTDNTSAGEPCVYVRLSSFTPSFCHRSRGFPFP